MKLTLNKLPLIFIFLIVFSVITFGQKELKKGIELYEKGKYAEAVQVLQGEKDGISRYYLGLSFEKLNQTKEAGKAFEKALVGVYEEVTQKLRDRLDQTIVGEKEKFSNFFGDLKNEVQFGIESAKKASEYKSKKSKKNEWLMKANSLFEINKLFENKETLYSYDEVDKNIELIRKPAPKYTNSARKNNVQGTVLTFVIFNSDGKTISVAPITYLTNGLTAEAIIAAKKIEFEPAVKNGKPVSYVSFLQHGFSIY